ncbi:TPA: GhoT/OrtT family toxin [Morganella morganii]|nr:GhoT/OrtT family toxin [Morganella morganii]HDF2362611.1 GhoT/OrtT family toxin [Morganella morganii]HDF2421837.1 GhoT/OrtT family toxin [Morganella morganii]
MSSAQILLTIYATGGLFSFILTFFLTKDPNAFFRLLSCLLIALTWPMSLPVVILFSLF